MRRLGGVIGTCLVVLGVTACIKWPWMREDPAAHSAANWYIDAGSEGGSDPGTGDPPSSTSSPPVAGGDGGASDGLDATGLQKLIASHRKPLRQCWERTNPKPAKVDVTISVQVSTSGRADTSTATGAGAPHVLTSCLEKEVKTWKFPSPAATTTVNLPLHFEKKKKP